MNLPGDLGGMLRQVQDIQKKMKNIEKEVRKAQVDRKSTRLNSSHTVISYAVFCLKKKIKK